MKTVLVEGDSTAFGMFDYEGGGWAHRLHLDTLAISARDVRRPTAVINRALPGRTAGAAVRSLRGDLRQFGRLGTMTVVGQFGLNEAKIFPGTVRPIVSLERFGDQVLTFCNIALEQNAFPILVGPQPVDETLCTPTPSGCILEDDLIEEYDQVMRDVADSEGAHYISARRLFAGHDLQDVLAADGYHPKELGHALLHDAIKDSLLQVEAL